MRLYTARRGLVNQPHPRGAFNPKLCRMMRFQEVRAAMRFLIDGRRKPNLTAPPEYWAPLRPACVVGRRNRASLGPGCHTHTMPRQRRGATQPPVFVAVSER